MNLLEIANYCIDQMDGTTAATVYNANPSVLAQEVRRLKQNINKAYTVVKLALGLKNENAETTFTLTTVAGQEAYSIPTGVLRVLELQYGSDPPFRIIPWTEFQRYKADTLLITDSGAPFLASIFAKQLSFYPVPDSTYTINGRGLAKLTTLDEDTDEPDLPSEFHQCVAEFALYYEMKYENNPQAGMLVVQENGAMNAQGGQAADALGMLRMVRSQSKAHQEEPPRMISNLEMRLVNDSRRIVRG
jgi:hypothetical protein